MYGWMDVQSVICERRKYGVAGHVSWGIPPLPSVPSAMCRAVGQALSELPVPPRHQLAARVEQGGMEHDVRASDSACVQS